MNNLLRTFVAVAAFALCAPAFAQELILYSGPDFHGRSVTLRKPGKTETRADDRLDVDETRVLRFPIAAADDGDARSLRVTLLFKPFPLLPEEQSFVLGEWSSPR